MTKAKITIIDDEVEYLNDLSRALEIFGYEVSKAANGAEGIKAILDNKPDVVLCDYKLPDMDGTRVIKDTREANTDAAYIMVTAYYDESFNEAFKKAGADQIIYKPIQLMEMDNIIKKAIYDKTSNSRR